MKSRMKLFWLFMILALPGGVTHCLSTSAAATVSTPQCYPGEPTATTAVTLQNNYGAAVVWYCDIGHQWMRWYFQGNWIEVKAFQAAYSFASLISLTHAQKDALWNAMPADTGQDDAIRQVVQAQTWITDVPPSGLATLQPFAYKTQAVTGGGFKMIAVGAIALGKVCIPTVKMIVDGYTYYGVARADVTMTKVGRWTPPYPNTAYGICT